MYIMHNCIQQNIEIGKKKLPYYFKKYHSGKAYTQEEKSEI